MLDNAISGYRHKVAFFKTPGDLWMLKGTAPNVCLTIAPNYRLQNEIPTIESSGNVITRRFVGPLLRRYCDRTKTPSAAEPTKRKLICEGRAIGSTPNDLADDVIRKSDDTSNADEVRQADDIRNQDDSQRQCSSTGCPRVQCGPESWPTTLSGLPWHIGRAYSGDSLISIADRSRSSPVKERTQSSLTVSLSRNKQVIGGGRIVQQPKSHAQYNFPVLYGNVNSRTFAIGEKKHFGQVEHEPKTINSFMEEETGCNSELRKQSRLNLQHSLVVSKLHPLKTRSGPTAAAKSSALIINRGANNTPENVVGTSKVDQECRATGEAEHIPGIRHSSGQSIASHVRCRRVTVQSASEPDATLLQKDHVMGKNRIFASHDHCHQAKDP